MASVFLLVILALLLNPFERGNSAFLPGAANPAAPKQAGLPVNGWEICADLGFGSVPGVSGSVQRMEMCHGDGWVVDVYCLEPEKLAPAVNTACSMISATDFWCGDEVQLVREYQLQQTAAPSSTPRPTATPVPSATATASATPLPSITATRPPAADTPSGGGGDTPTPVLQATVFIRPHAGGGGITAPLLSGIAAALGLGLLAAAILLNRQR